MHDLNGTEPGFTFWLGALGRVVSSRTRSSTWSRPPSRPVRGLTFFRTVLKEGTARHWRTQQNTRQCPYTSLTSMIDMPIDV